jgi:hypothetical protein
VEIKAFLQQVVEGYLFHDLETMRTAEVKTKDGHCGYPMVMSCMAGAELLGLLSGKTPFGPSEATKEPTPSLSFVRYWSEYLYTTSPRRDAGFSLYQLLRHGVAHTFAGKEPIGVTRHESARHLTNGLYQGVPMVVVDGDQLFADFKASYYDRFLPVALGTKKGPQGEDAASMQGRLDNLFAYNAAKAKTHGGPLANLPTAPSPGGSPTGYAAPVPITSSRPPGS